MSIKTKTSRQDTARAVSGPKKRAFWIITLSLPVVLLILLEIGLRIFNYGGNIDLFVSIPDETSKYYGINLEIAKRYFTTLGDVPSPRKDLFLKEKPVNGYRIFVLGESSAAGFPYGNNLTFSRILNRRLSDIFPDKYVEIVNTGITAINSYAQLDFMDEILKYKPDAILVYAGHNEYYGALGVASRESIGKSRWMVQTALALKNVKIYLLMRDVISGIKNLFKASDEGNPSATLMERIVGDEIIPLNSDEYNSGKKQFEENLREIIRKAQDAGVKIILSELVSNIRDNKPFESVEVKGLPSAQNIYNKALLLEKDGEFNEAKKEYYHAKDLDALRFRAPEEFNSIIDKLAQEYKVPVVPMKSYFEAASPNGMIGNNLMLEHLHPNIDGYFLMADAFLNTLQKEKLIEQTWRIENIKPSSFYNNSWGLTKLDSTYAALTILRLKGGWPFKKLHGPNLSLLDFKPADMADSVALSILTSTSLTLEQGHINLAEYYERKGEFEKAFNEYNALIYTVPFFDLFYEPAVKILLSMENYDKAFDVLNQQLKYQETAFADQWIGQIYLINNKPEKGISFLEKAISLGSQDPVVFYNLGRAYYNTAQYQKGDEILGQLKQKLAGSRDSRNTSLITMLEEYRSSADQNRVLSNKH